MCLVVSMFRSENSLQCAHGMFLRVQGCGPGCRWRGGALSCQSLEGTPPRISRDERTLVRPHNNVCRVVGCCAGWRRQSRPSYDVGSAMPHHSNTCIAVFSSRRWGVDSSGVVVCSDAAHCVLARAVGHTWPRRAASTSTLGISTWWSDVGYCTFIRPHFQKKPLGCRG
jgi:hypothetical protein